MDDKMFQPIDDEERRIMESLQIAPIDSTPTRDDERRKAVEAAKNPGEPETALPSQVAGEAVGRAPERT